MKSILDPTFDYVPSARTDLSKTFERVRAEAAARKIAAEQQASPLPKILFSVGETRRDERAQSTDDVPFSCVRFPRRRPA